MSPLFILINTLLTVGLYIIILRIWMQNSRVNYFNPFTQFIVKITQPFIGPLRKLIPSVGRLDTATLIILYLVGLVKIIFIYYYLMNVVSWNFVYLFLAIAAILHAVGHLIFWLLLFRAILSWVNRGQSIADDLLVQLTEPLVAPIRRIVPPLGMIDISFMILVFILMILNMFAPLIFGRLWIFL